MILWGVVWGSRVFLDVPEACGKHPMDLQTERGVCSESIVDSDKGPHCGMGEGVMLWAALLVGLSFSGGV